VTGRTGGAPGTWRTRYLHTDHLGSVSSITDETGAEVAAFSFDAWGKRRAPTLASLIAQIGSPWANMTAWQKGNLTLAASVFGSALTNRGFTGHEQLDAVGLVHMGGRVYDAQIGRFLSADPFVQDPTDLQGLNRYSYVQNNPLSYTDPSGYFLKKLFRKTANAIGNAMEAVGEGVKKFAQKVVRQFLPQVIRAAGYYYCEGNAACQRAFDFAADVVASEANGGTRGKRDPPSATAFTQQQRESPARSGGNGGGSDGWMMFSLAQQERARGRSQLKNAMRKANDGGRGGFADVAGINEGIVLAGAGGRPPLNTIDLKILNTIGRGNPREMRDLMNTLDATGDLTPASRELLRRAAIQAETRFGANAHQSSHAFRHTDKLGLDRVGVESAIRADLAGSDVTASLAIGEGATLTTTVQGVQVTYRVHRVSDVFVNVGRITGQP
jgi:RHS repeat-associated protein